MPDGRALTVVATIPVVPLAADRWLLTAKFVEGMRAYVAHWDGPVTALLPRADAPTDNLDNVECAAAELPFRVEALPFETSAVRERLRGAAIVLGGPHHQLPGLSSACADLGIPCVYNTEYSLRTRLQIARAEAGGPLVLARRAQWETLRELRVRRELRRASGVQCNGTPTFDAYRHATPAPLLYFDTRTADHEVASTDELEGANARRRAGGRLELAFSGRLIPMKGAGDLPGLALALRRRQVDFRLRIFGDGSLVPELRRAIDEHGLADRVSLEGVLDFHHALHPLMKREVDLFVCCHPQGDPSCTYLETFAAGVPIAGYGNEAFAGLLRHADVGWSTPIGAVDALADRVAALDRERAALAAAAVRALAFAREHTFETTFRRRVEHLRELSSGRGVAPMTTR